ncbi:MAG: hypothetical protein IJA35_07620 [Clostridia bacterium]|nr:hypothetical protein [Clostridia bacterium]
MNKLLKDHYAKSQAGGRSKLGRIFDFVFFRLLLFGVLYLIFSDITSSHISFFSALVTTIAIIILFELFRKFRFERFVKKYKKRLSEQYTLERLALLDPASIKSICLGLSCKGTVIVLQKISEITLDDLIAALRGINDNIVHIYSISAYSGTAQEFIRSAILDKQQIILHNPSELITATKQAGQYIGTHEAEAMLLQKLQYDQAQKKPVLKRFFTLIPTNVKRYAILGITLFIMSFIVKHGLYYQLMSMLCFSLTTLSIWTNAAKKQPDQQ